jgi:membrane protease YdiL (CAAX protease family)
MITLEQFVSVFFGFLPLYFAMVLIPSIVSSLVLSYVMRAGLIRQSLAAKVMEVTRPLMGAANTFAMIVVVAPFAEEIIFRGVPMIIHPVLAWVGTIGWALAHGAIVSAEIAGSALGSPKALLAGVAHALYFLSAGIFYMLIWSLGIPYGSVAITYHVIHNLWVFIAECKLFPTRREEPARTVRPLEPLPIPIIGRPVARREGRPEAQPPLPSQTVKRRVLREGESSLYIPPEELIRRTEEVSPALSRAWRTEALSQRDLRRKSGQRP